MLSLMCEKFHNDRLRNDRSLGNRNSDNNNPKNKHTITTLVALGDPSPGLEINLGEFLKRLTS